MKIARSNRFLLHGLAALAAAAASGIVYANIPDENGVIHACYATNGAQTPGGAALKIVDGSCTNGQTEVTWGQVGPQGPRGEKGDKGDTGDPGAPGEQGPAGISAAYTNYDVGLQTIGEGLTRTVASVTVPAGSYVLSAVVTASDVDDFEYLQCGFFAPGSVHGHFAILLRDLDVQPMIGDATVGFEQNTIFLRCEAREGTIRSRGEMIATQVATVTPSN